MNKRELDKRIRIERPIADASFAGAGSDQWAKVAEVWAGVRDMLPSRGEKLANGINVAARPARVRMRYRDGITPDMRFVLLRKGQPERIMQIVSGPAEIGRRDGLEFMVEDYSTVGGGG